LHRKITSILLMAALVGGLLSVAAAPALANHTGDPPPPASLLPDDDGLSGAIGTALSDRDDGTDTAAHLSAIAPPFTDQVEWRRCATTVTGPIDNTEIAACNVILGTDTSGVPLGEGGGFPPVTPDQAFDLKYDITAADEANSPADVITLACQGAGRTLANCLVNLDENVSFDDAVSGLPGAATTSGEMVSICTADLGGPGGATDLCQVGGAGAGTDAQVAARFAPYEHGDPVPNDGFVLRATTSPDLNAANPLAFFRDWSGISSAAESDAFDQAGTCTLLNATATSALWECAFADAGAADDDALQEIGIVNDLAAAQGLCSANFCILDAHASASQERAAAAVSAYFVPGSGDLEAVASDSACATPDAADANSLGSDSLFRGCVQDQFGQPFTPAQVTAEFDPADVGAINGGGIAGAVCTDTDTDGETDHCERVAATSSTATFDEFQFGLSNVVEPGTQTVTFCPDEDDNGCADEALTATVVKTWESIADTVFLTYNGTATDTTTLFSTCTSGDTFRENVNGDRDDLLACTFDAVGLPNPVPASTDKPGGGRLQWFIVPSGGGELTATRFIGTPPRETGADATAMATLEAFRGGNDIITVELQNELGNFVDAAAVQKRVTQTRKPRVRSTITIRGKFRGRVNSVRNPCERRRRVVLKKVRPGPDRTVGRDRTNAQGRWRINKPNAKGRFYARAVKKETATIICRPARSRTVRRR
jgi:hypothetical protein